MELRTLNAVASHLDRNVVLNGLGFRHPSFPDCLWPGTQHYLLLYRARIGRRSDGAGSVQKSIKAYQASS